MKKKDMLFIVIVFAVLAVVVTLSVTGKKPPLMPHDASHTEVTKKEQCRECHAKGGEYPMKEGHPFKDDCFMCHKEGGRMAAE